ncbi:CPBP family intramembrane glutamic endopeptidase [Candidatus Cyanaurora vandensis]|uniref:CPBP family intramembrane glutamic endopeptidase n=1 Tax=Candidatus Cyanaurora vandensis TaxID=2714958 RepID=UPI00257C2381|nr:type II CAAX endopeptidase family protein [Candidatus Cyanaurora vandensis]
MPRFSLLTVWVLCLASLILTAIIGTLTQPARQNLLALSAEDLQLELLWLEKDPALGPVVAGFLPPDVLAETRDNYAEVYEKTPPATPGLAALRLKLGLLYAETGLRARALQLWQEAGTGGQVLTGLYREPPVFSPTGEAVLQQTLTGWYQQVGLQRLYRLGGRDTGSFLAGVQAQARVTLYRLLVLTSLQSVLVLSGVVFLIREALQWQSGKRSWGKPWVVPWTVTDAVWVVAGWLTVFLLGLPFIVMALVGPIQRWVTPPDLASAFTGALGYLLGMGAGLGLLWYRIWRLYPLSEPFRVHGQGLSWAGGAYVASLPLVFGAAALTQTLVGDRGGGNQTLTEILGAENLLAQAIFLVTVTILAPVFEEILFRGLLFTSLTTVLSIPQAMLLSGLVFGAIHGSAAELLPLSVLGVVLAYAYHQTRNLAVPILIHLLFNGVTFGTLIVLGGA